MKYRYKNCFKNGKLLGDEYFYATKVIPIIDISIPYFNKEGKEMVKAGKIFDIQYKNGIYQLSGFYPCHYYAVSEEVLNKYFVILNTSFIDEEKKGLKIYKGAILVYKSQDSGLHRMKEYVQYIDAPLKRMFLFEEPITRCFMGKTLKVIYELQKTVKKATDIEINKCIKSVNQYLITTIKTMENISQKTDLSNTINIHQLIEATKAQEFLEDMKYRNQVALDFLNS